MAAGLEFCAVCDGPAKDAPTLDERYWRVRAQRAEREVERLEDRLDLMHLLATAAIRVEAQRGIAT